MVKADHHREAVQRRFGAAGEVVLPSGNRFSLLNGLISTNLEIVKTTLLAAWQAVSVGPSPPIRETQSVLKWRYELHSEAR
jgi:hypothetical protein